MCLKLLIIFVVLINFFGEIVESNVEWVDVSFLLDLVIMVLVNVINFVDVGICVFVVFVFWIMVFNFIFLLRDWLFVWSSMVWVVV